MLQGQVACHGELGLLQGDDGDVDVDDDDDDTNTQANAHSELHHSAAQANPNAKC